MTPEVYLKQPARPLPELRPGQIRYVVAGDGVYLERRTSMYATATPTPGPLAGLLPHAPTCTLLCGRIPRLLIRSMLAFFRDAYELHRGEAALVLLYHPGRRAFRWHCPHQTVEVYRSYGRLRAWDSITYDMPLQLPPGYLIFGDAHDHGDLPASPSGTDRGDEVHKDGLHLIVGRIDRLPRVEYHVDFVMDGHRFPVEPADILEDLSCSPLPRAPAAWMQRIHMKGPAWLLGPGSRHGDDARDGWFDS